MTVSKVQGSRLHLEVIAKGKLLYSRLKDSYEWHVSAAPVGIDMEDYIELVLIRKSENHDETLYVHEVVLKQKAPGASRPIEAIEPDGHQGLLKHYCTIYFLSMVRKE